MKLEEFAKSVLLGSTLEDKLIIPPSTFEPSLLKQKFSHPFEIPQFPGRPKKLSHMGRAEFPSVHRLNQELERARVLHFFANHELLAMELMALVILRFPEAPQSFREGLARIIQEEQDHLRLYLSRMRELGIDFGDLPLNDYFWNRMKQVNSPLDFTVQMSLTFEQANLDFALYFMKEVAKTGDEATTALLERVFREEIGHVKHGLIWFNRWRERADEESDWQAYVRLLPHPLNPQRAKGLEFAEEARRQAGLSEEFIRELKIYSGSKGRPSILWYFNPQCDAEIARGKPGHTPSQGAQSMAQDLAFTPLFLAHSQDLLLVPKRPNTSWLESLHQAGFSLPELTLQLPSSKIGGIQPWGWSPEVFEKFRPLAPQLIEVDGGNSKFCKSLFQHSNYSETGLGPLFSKAWSTEFYRSWLKQHPEATPFFGDLSILGSVLTTWEQVQACALAGLTSHDSLMMKAPYGTSGMQVKQLRSAKELQGNLGGWARNIIQEQGAFIVEPYLNPVADFSLQLEILEDRIHLLEARHFLTGNQREYRGTLLGRKLLGLSSEEQQFFYRALPFWQRLARDLGAELRNQGYLGPAGIDALLWKNARSELRFKPLIELNPRWTMGRVALELEKRISPSQSAIFLFIPLKEIQAQGYRTASEFAQKLKEKHPIILSQSGGSQRIQSGVVFTQDPEQVQNTLSLMATLPHPELNPFLKPSLNS